MCALAALTILLGLASRRFPYFGNYPGDALWATLVGFLWALALPKLRLRWIAAATVTTSFCVELSQLYRANWIDTVRATLAGRLVLGSGFDPLDLIAYTFGALLAILTLWLLRVRQKA